jgi:hypothetical protein
LGTVSFVSSWILDVFLSRRFESKAPCWRLGDPAFSPRPLIRKISGRFATIRGALAEAAWNGHAQRRDAFIDQQEHGRCTPTAILLFRRLIRERIEEAESLPGE